MTNKAKTLCKKISIAVVASLLMVAMLVPTTVMASTKEKFGSSKCCTATINQSLINKKGKQYATVKLSTFDGIRPWNSGAKIYITMTDEKGRHIWSGVKKGGDTLKLGDDHRIYKIFVKVYDEPVKGGLIMKSIISGNNFTNRGKCDYWQFTNAKDCKIS